jgi:transposase InsO family protein
MRERSKTEQGDREDGDTLTAVIRAGARKLIAQVLKAEVAELLATYADQQDGQGRARVVLNGHHPEREMLYLAMTLDLYHRKVIGWAMGRWMTQQLVIDTFTMALKNGCPGRGFVHHSDQGVQYACHAFQALLKVSGSQCSMSRKGNCGDNAVAESFFHTLKVELIHAHQYHTRQEARREIFEYIEVFYNRQRRHSALGYRTPVELEKMASTA